MDVFFYGLFMDEQLLAAKDVRPSRSAVGFVEGFALHIGQRATLQQQPGGRAYGVLMTVSPAEAASLYSEDSVADYVAEPVTVELMDGTKADAACYNLPEGTADGTNRTYAAALFEVASRLGLPEDYLSQISRAGR